jgi:ABC-type nitrate/sulfonate/bicarbonate transport system permease component
MKLIARAGATFQTDKVFVGVALLAAVGWFLTALFQWIEERLSPWRSR